MLRAEELVLIYPKVIEIAKPRVGKWASTCPTADLDELAHGLSTAMGACMATTIVRQAAILGQVGVESGQCRWWSEFPTDSDPNFLRYERSPLKERLGNTQPGDGERFSGHGLLQLTGRLNHALYGEWLVDNAPALLKSVDTVADPVSVSKSVLAGCLTIAFYWERHRLNELADDVSFGASGPVMDSFRRITRKVNGGDTHYDQRAEFFLRALQVLGKEAARR